MRNYIQELEHAEEIKQAERLMLCYALNEQAEELLCNALDLFALLDRNPCIRSAEQVIFAVLRQIRINNAK